eukprot:scaffold7268_cov93-Skeletonema_marinoi.AAC.4
MATQFPFYNCLPHYSPPPPMKNPTDDKKIFYCLQLRDPSESTQPYQRDDNSPSCGRADRSPKSTGSCSSDHGH